MRYMLLTVALLLATAFPASADVADTRTERALFLPGAKFKLVIPREDWVITREQPRADGRSVYYALSSAKREMTAWLFIDQTPVCQNATACLEFALKNTAYSTAKDMKFDTQDPFKVVEFTLEGTADAPSQQRLVASAYVDGCWIDVHLFQPAREGASAALRGFLKVVSIQ
jgi:hypothetical protein